MKWWDQMPWSSFSECWVLSHFSTLPFHFDQEALYFFFTFCHKGGVICISEGIDISPAILISVYASFSPAFLVMYSPYKLNKQGDNIQPWHNLFPVWNQSVVPCPVLTIPSWPAYRFLRSKSGDLVFPSLSEFSSLLWSTQSKALASSIKQK